MFRFTKIKLVWMQWAYHKCKTVVQYIKMGIALCNNNGGKTRRKPIILGEKNCMNYFSHQGVNNVTYMYILAAMCITSN